MKTRKGLLALLTAVAIVLFLAQPGIAKSQPAIEAPTDTGSWIEPDGPCTTFCKWCGLMCIVTCDTWDCACYYDPAVAGDCVCDLQCMPAF